MSLVPAWPHCPSCTCSAPTPSTFVSDVAALPVDLDRDYTWGVGRWNERELHTLPLLQCVHWRPERRRTLQERVAHYRLLLEEGICRNVREAVKATAVKRREWEIQETARHAEHLAKKFRDRHWRSGARQRVHKKDRVLARATSCAYCGILNPRTVDHVTPIARGSDDRSSNLAPACHKCNCEKGNRTPDEWKADRLRAGLPWPPPLGSNEWTLPLASELSWQRVSPPQLEVLTTLASPRANAVHLAWADRRTLESLERRGLILRWPDDQDFHVITDRGRLALETGRLPR